MSTQVPSCTCQLAHQAFRSTLATPLATSKTAATSPAHQLGQRGSDDGAQEEVAAQQQRPEMRRRQEKRRHENAQCAKPAIQ